MNAATASCTILIVEDDSIARAGLATLLQSEGYRTVSAGDGLSAINLIRAGMRPDVILLDMILPGADGWQFFAERMRDRGLVAVPVVIMTGVGIACAEWAKALGAADLLRKPIDLDRLLAVVRRYVRPPGETNAAGPTAESAGGP